VLRPTTRGHVGHLPPRGMLVREGSGNRRVPRLPIPRLGTTSKPPARHAADERALDFDRSTVSLPSLRADLRWHHLRQLDRTRRRWRRACARSIPKA